MRSLEKSEETQSDRFGKMGKGTELKQRETERETINDDLGGGT
jgi:hypothetical protein